MLFSAEKLPSLTRIRIAEYRQRSGSTLVDIAQQFSKNVEPT